MANRMGGLGPGMPEAWAQPARPVCGHLDQIGEYERPERFECPTCVAIGSTWVHLRQCLGCGQVGCCDNSPNRHARRHFEDTGHPIMRSLEPGEMWRWCWADDTDV